MKMKTSFYSPLFVSLIYLLLLGADFFREKLTGAGGNEYLSIIIVQLLIFIIPAILFCRLRGVGYTSKMNIRLVAPSKFGSVIVASLVLIFGSILIRFTQIYLFNLKDFPISFFERYLTGATEYNFLFAAAAFAIIPALTDEFVFRSILLTEYNEGGYGAVTATLVSSILSSMMFFTLESFPIRFFSAIVLCMLTYATGSSLSAFAAHLVFNIYTVFGEKYIIETLSDPSNKIISVFTFALLFLVLSVIMFSEFEHIFRQLGKNGVPSPSYMLKKSEDGKTPDIAATEVAEKENASKKVVSEKTKLTIEALFSPSFIVCIIIFAVAVLTEL
jgi:sodium transport system permease protein